MKIIVKLYGTLAANFPGYDPEKGLELELPDGSSVKKLLARLDIPDNAGCFVSMNSRVVKEDRKLSPNAEVLILQSLAGG